MAGLRADEYEADVDSIDLDVVDPGGNVKVNWTLFFKEEGLRPCLVSEEKERFFQALNPHPGPHTKYVWVIVKKSGEETRMDENQRVLYYQRTLQNSYIQTQEKPSA